MIELDITFGKQDLTITQNGEVLKPNSEGVVDIKTEEPLIDSVSVNGQNLPIDAEKNVNLVIMQDGNVVKPNADGSIDIKGGGGGGSDAVFLWDENSDVDNYTETGIFHFAGYRMTTNDHLPIDNAGEKDNISFTLIVDRSEGKFFESEQYHLKSGVSQTVIIDNNAGGDTKIFTRHGTITVAGASPEDIGVVTWEAHWQELVGSTYLGVIQHSGGYGLDGYNTNEVLRGCTENGLYTGAFIAAPQIFDVFKLEVMNNYAMAQVYGTGNTVLQTLTILSTQGNDAIPTEGNGAHATLQRKGTWNGSVYEWTEWESLSFEVPTATQTTLGAVKGSDTVRVEEDGSLSVEYQELNYLSQGRNVLIGGDGKINVDGVSHTTIDNDLSDGEINDVKVYYEPTKTLADLRHEYKNEIAGGWTQTESKIVQVPSLYQADNEKSLVGTISNQESHLDSKPLNIPSSTQMQDFGERLVSYNHTAFEIWGDTNNRAKKVIDEMKKEGYNGWNGAELNLESNFGQYPYYGGRFVFELTVNDSGGYRTSNYKLYNNQDEWLGNLEYDNGKYVLSLPSVRADRQMTNWEDYLPLSLKCHFEIYKNNAAGNFSLTLTIKTEESESPSWTNIQTNSTGRVMRVVGYKTVTYPDTITTYDHTRCIAIAKDGISIQSVNDNHEQKELYINIDDSGNIVTNIGEFING